MIEKFVWNEFLKGIKKEIKSLKEELEESDGLELKEIVQADLESLKDEYEMMSQKYSEEIGKENIPSFDELVKNN